jgi:hypothetical protein
MGTKLILMHFRINGGGDLISDAASSLPPRRKSPYENPGPLLGRAFRVGGEPGPTLFLPPPKDALGLDPARAGDGPIALISSMS